MKNIICIRCMAPSPPTQKSCRHCQRPLDGSCGPILADVMSVRAQLFWSVVVAGLAGIIGLILAEKVLVWT